MTRFARWLRARLIDDWHRAWRYASVWIPAASIMLIEAWNQMPADLRALMPAPVQRVAPLALFAAVLIGRLVKQKGATDGR